MIYEIRTKGILRREENDDAVETVKRALAQRDPSMSWARARELAEAVCHEAARRAPRGANIYGVAVKALVPVGYALAVPIAVAFYRDLDCPNCGRHRVWATGVCEKCRWDVDGGDYVIVTRPRNVCLVCRSECDDFGVCDENHELEKALGAR